MLKLEVWATIPRRKSCCAMIDGVDMLAWDGRVIAGHSKKIKIRNGYQEAIFHKDAQKYGMATRHCTV